MEGIFLDYYDPLFGIIIFVLIIFIASFLTYSYNIYKEKQARSEYKELLERFGIGSLDEQDYVHLYKTFNLPFDSIMLLASSFALKGDYNKSISIYLTLLEHVQDRVKKEELLEILGTTYFKGGFLKRSADIFLTILEFAPRNINALKYLLLSYEKLKEWDKALDVLESLNELNIDIKEEKTYIIIQKIINDPLLSYDKKTSKIIQIFEFMPSIARIVAQYLLIYNKTLFWEKLENFDIGDIVDLLWYLDFNDVDFDYISQNPTLKTIYCAKGYITNENQASFSIELDILSKLALYDKELRSKVDLGFDFVCKKCKKTYPMYEARCPHCHSILSFKVKPKLIKRMNIEENLSLQ